MKRSIAVLTVIALFGETLCLAGLGDKKAAYVGGTAACFAETDKAVEGTLDASDAGALFFHYKDGKSKETFSIQWDRITGLEYGQKAGRRVGAAVGTAILVSPVGLFLLFSKKRKHYLTIDYDDAEGKAQVAIFELGKKIVRNTLAVTETRSGQPLAYQDEEARKTSKGD